MMRRDFTPTFTLAQAETAFQRWGANCGPGALAAIMQMTLDDVRPHMHGFEDRRYTNPSMMAVALRSIGRPWRKIGSAWPVHGLARIQWEGPWTLPGVPFKARYRQTHWVAAAVVPGTGLGIFDINALANGTGWTSLANWTAYVVPFILENCVPRASGGWHITHAIEVEPKAVAR